MQTDLTPSAAAAGPTRPRRRVLITAGPTHEPIDSVRFIGNRSSGRLGIGLAEEAARRGQSVHLMLGPSCLSAPAVAVSRFETTAELQGLLAARAPESDIIIMAAAVADFRPAVHTSPDGPPIKLRRGGSLALELEPTPDLLAELAFRRRQGQFIVGFALEPRESLLASAREKLDRKRIDLIIANPLETMEAPGIDAIALSALGGHYKTPGTIPKEEFAAWLLDLIDAQLAAPRQGG